MRRNHPEVMAHQRHSKLTRVRSTRLFRTAVLIVFMLVVSGCSGLFGSGTPEASMTFSVVGRVYDGQTAEAIVDAYVAFGDHARRTNDEGQYAFTNVVLPENPVLLKVTADGYETYTKSVPLKADQSTTLDIPLQPVPTEPGDGDENGGTGGDDGTPGGDDDGDLPGDGDSGTAPPPVYDGSVAVSVKLANTPFTVSPQEVGAPPLPAPEGVRPIANLRQTTVNGHVPGEWVVELDGDYPVQTVTNFWGEAGVQVERRLGDNFYIVSGDESEADDVEAMLASLPNVVSVGRNRLVSPISFTGPVFPNDEHYFRQWGLPMISAPYAWSLTTGSQSVIVAVIDTGLRAEHPDINRNAIIAGRNFVSGQTAANYTDNTNHFSHGTMVAGIIGARTDNGTGVAGLNWNATLMPIRVIGSNGGGTVTGVGEGIKWAVDNGAHVINMSLAWDSNPGDAGERYVRQQIERAAANGVTIVAGAGNDGGRITMPAAHPEVIAVGAVDKNKRVTWYSNYGNQLDLVAPGGDQGRASSDGIASTDIVNGRLYYSYSEGTSFASPHVAGVAALMYSRGITDPNEVRDILRDTAEDLSGQGFDPYYGYGLVNAYAAVAGIRRTDAFVGIAGADEYGIAPVQPLQSGDERIAHVEGIEPGTQTVYAWIDVNGDGVLDDGDFAALADVRVSERTTTNAELTLRVVDTLSQAEQRRLEEIINR